MILHLHCMYGIMFRLILHLHCMSSIRAGLESMTSQNGGQDGGHGSNPSPGKGYDL